MDEKTNKIKNINRQIGMIKTLYCRIEELKIAMNSDNEKGKIAI